MIFVHGRKHHASELEEVIGRVAGVRAGKAAVIGSHDPRTGGECVVAFVSLDTPDLPRSVPVLGEIAARLQEALGFPVAHVLPLPRAAFPRTTSGKLQRYKLRADWEAGLFDELAARVDEAVAVLSGKNGGAPRRSEAPGEEVTGAGDDLSRASFALLDTHPPAIPGTVDVPGKRGPAPGAGSCDEVEERVAAIWARVLRMERPAIGVADRFRALGGTSLQAMEVLALLEAEFAVEIDPSVLMDRSTVAELADWLRAAPLARPEAERGSPSRRAPEETRSGIAVLSMACRFPDAPSPERFWANLVGGVDSVREVPPDRWDAARLYDPTGKLPGRSVSKWGSFLSDPAAFDPAFFNIEPDEAAVMDPQQRILLEVAYEALERAGYAGERRARKRVGVFVGAGEVNYQELLLGALAAGVPLHASAAVGNLRNLIAGRIAHCLNLTGPAIAVDTACSSSLVALHLASASLLRGECDLALVGGVNLNLTATPYQLLSGAGALSPSGRCRAFDGAADGMVPGEGAGVILLAPLRDAEREGDPVLGIIRGSAVNNDGRSLSPMAPNPAGQAAVLEQAYRESGIDPATVTYIETHGTGTPIGDPIEARSLARTFPPPPDGTLRALGSVKTNVGHLLNGAGMPSLIKTLLMLQHRQIPPSLHHTTPNSRFDLRAAGFEVATQPRAWDVSGPLRAGVDGFGFGGTNAHVILEEAPARRTPDEQPSVPDRSAHLLTLSARTEPALRRSAGDLAAYIRAHPEIPVADVFFSASTAREAREPRAALLADAHLPERLEAFARGQPGRDTWTGTQGRSRRRVAFLFPGQGSLVPGMGKQLFDTEPGFRRALERAAAGAGMIEAGTCWTGASEQGWTPVNWRAPPSRSRSCSRSSSPSPGCWRVGA